MKFILVDESELLIFHNLLMFPWLREEVSVKTKLLLLMHWLILLIVKPILGLGKTKMLTLVLTLAAQVLS